MRQLIFLLAFISVSLAGPTLKKETARKWIEYKNAFNKQYENAEEESRRIELFTNKLAEIEKHNEKYRLGETTYEKGLNQFSDMFPMEIDAILGLKVPTDLKGCTTTAPTTTTTTCPSTKAPTTSADPNDELDYRSKSTPIRSQAQCGSCWAFSTVAVVEGNLCVFKGADRTKLDLSEQQLVDCATDGCRGCNGGWPKAAMEYVGENALCSEANYPYVGKDGTCTLKGDRIGGGGTAGYINPKYDVPALKAGLRQKGLIGIGIEATSDFMSYKSGIFNGDCGTTQNHAVTLLGFHTHDGKGTWIVENSWGTGWGDNGYFEFERGINKCGCEEYGMYYKLN